MGASGQQYDDVAAAYAAAYAWVRQGAGPREPAALVDLAALVEPREGGLILDLGAYDGRWATGLRARFRCSAVAVDIAITGLAQAISGGVPSINADMTRLPVRSDSVTLAWSRDALSMVSDVDGALSEIARVLRPGAGAVLYAAITTTSLELNERAELVDALDMPEWWNDGRRPIDRAIAAARLEVVHEERISPENQEAALAERNPEFLDDLVLLARLERNREDLERLLGVTWTERVRAWSRWPLYLLLGKLETRAWVLRRPQ
jgi:SAM-dependent methyltransferase